MRREGGEGGVRGSENGERGGNEKREGEIAGVSAVEPGVYPFCNNFSYSQYEILF